MFTTHTHTHTKTSHTISQRVAVPLETQKREKQSVVGVGERL